MSNSYLCLKTHSLIHCREDLVCYMTWQFDIIWNRFERDIINYKPGIWMKDVIFGCWINSCFDCLVILFLLLVLNSIAASLFVIWLIGSIIALIIRHVSPNHLLYEILLNIFYIMQVFTHIRVHRAFRFPLG